MKNIIKKISAVAMAFTLLGAGSTTLNAIAPKTANSITVSAAYCSHPMESREGTAWKYTTHENLPSYYVSGKGLCTPVRYYEYIHFEEYCHKCNSYVTSRNTFNRTYVINYFQ